MKLDETSMWLGSALVLLGIESQQVIGLRWIRLAAGGPRAHQEAVLMVCEKLLANGKAALRLSLGRFPSAIVDDYRAIVRANITRLSK